MGCETVDTTGKDLLRVIPGEYIFSRTSKLQESLNIVVVLKESGFDAFFCIPVDVNLDGGDVLP